MNKYAGAHVMQEITQRLNRMSATRASRPVVVLAIDRDRSLERHDTETMGHGQQASATGKSKADRSYEKVARAESGPRTR